MYCDQQFHAIAIVVSFYLLHLSIATITFGWPGNVVALLFYPSILIFIIGVASWLQTWSSSE